MPKKTKQQKAPSGTSKSKVRHTHYGTPIILKQKIGETAWLAEDFRGHVVQVDEEALV